MSTYTVMPRRRQAGYKVEIVTGGGSRHAVLGFETEAEATAWAEADKERERMFNPAFFLDAD
jgi:hypothetical protein